MTYADIGEAGGAFVGEGDTGAGEVCLEPCEEEDKVVPLSTNIAFGLLLLLLLLSVCAGWCCVC